MIVMVTPPWWPLSPWLSPGAAWFIFFNAVVADTAVMSSCSQQQDGHVPASSRRRICRSASSVVLDQFRSFSLFSVHPTAGGVTVPRLDDLTDDSDYYHCSQEAEVVPAPYRQVTEVTTVVPATPRPTAPVAGESFAMAARAVTPTAPAAAAEAAAAAADESASGPEGKDEEADAEDGRDKLISLDEAYAIVQQQRRSQQSPSAPAAAAPSVATTTTAASWPQKTKDLTAKSPKRRRRREAEQAPEGKAELNARAELFIRQFREELKLQRLNSLVRHTHAFGPRDGAPTAVR